MVEWITTSTTGGITANIEEIIVVTVTTAISGSEGIAVGASNRRTIPHHLTTDIEIAAAAAASGEMTDINV